MKKSYQELRKKLRAQTKYSRNRDVRVKVELILLAHKIGSVSEACSRRGFSRKFYYKWWKRLKKAKYQICALEEMSRRPKHSPERINKKIERSIFYYNKRGYGGRMIKALLSHEDIVVSKSTICHVLNRRQKKIKKRKNKTLKAHHRRYELVIPGQRLQLDVKYVPERINGLQVYNFVVVDECTRWRFARGYFDINAKSTVDFLEKLKLICPFPIHTIQTDNGFEFTNRLNPNRKSIHPMDRWCQRMGVRHKLIPPGEKELNGKVERSHRIDEQYFYWKAPTTSLDGFNRALDHWIKFYNHKRPHGGLDYGTPWQKLLERLQTLKTQSVDEYLELFKLRFLNQTPMRLSEEQRLLQVLEFELKKLNNAA